MHAGMTIFFPVDAGYEHAGMTNLVIVIPA